MTMRIKMAPHGKPYIMLPCPGMGFSYAEKGGRLVLRGEESWKKINGFWINTKWGCCWIAFRRVGR